LVEHIRIRLCVWFVAGCRHAGGRFDGSDPDRSVLNRDLRDQEETLGHRPAAAVRPVLHHRCYGPCCCCSRRTAAGRHAGTRLLRQGPSTLRTLTRSSGTLHITHDISVVYVCRHTRFDSVQMLPTLCFNKLKMLIT